jgi:hypothetical protein
MTEEQITHAARAICATQAAKQNNDYAPRHLVGDWLPPAIWLSLVEAGIRKGMEIERTGVAGWLLKYGERQTADGVKRADYIVEQSQ